MRKLTYHAWLNAALQRQKYLPKLETLVPKRMKPKYTLAESIEAAKQRGLKGPWNKEGGATNG